MIFSYFANKSKKEAKKEDRSYPAEHAKESRLPALFFFTFILWNAERERGFFFFFLQGGGGGNCLNADDVITLESLHQHVLCFYNDMEMGLEGWQAAV